MTKCIFLSCIDEGKHEATFVSETDVKQLQIVGMVCDLHNRYTSSGGELSVLFRRALDRPAEAGYTTPSPTLPGGGPTPTGG